jgi:hypothetical protein
MKILVWLVICLSRDCWERTLILSQKENLLNLGVWYALVHEVLCCWCFVLFVDVCDNFVKSLSIHELQIVHASLDTFLFVEQ